MIDIGTRIRERRKRLGWTVQKLAVLAEIDNGFLSKIENGKTTCSTETLARIAGALGLSLSVLFQNESNVEEASIGYRRIPVLDYVQAGRWTGVDDWGLDDEMREVVLTDLEHPPSTFAMRLRGDSMEPKFKAGDVVVIAPTVEPRPGDFVVARSLEGEATFKQYRLGGLNEKGQEFFELWPLNPLYAPMRSDRQELAIVGTMVEYRGYRAR